MAVPEAHGDARVVARAPAGVPGEECRIDALPDDLLLRAISRLDVRDLMRTCVLSRRWRDLWRSATRINASRRAFDGAAGTDEERNALFKGFVSRFLMLRDPVALDALSLCYHVPEATPDSFADTADAGLWIGHALQCNARTVEVSGWDTRLNLDPAVFASECILTSLELSQVILFPGFFRSLRAGCRLLERLILRDCAIGDSDISSPTLKILKIDADSHVPFVEQASISIPNLIELHFFAFGRIPLLKDVGSLVTASIAVRTDNGTTQFDDFRQLLNSLSGVTNLQFDHSGRFFPHKNHEEILLKMEKKLELCPKFDNLTVLTVGDWWLHEDFPAFVFFFQNSPNLVKLTLKTDKIGSAIGSQRFSRMMGKLKEVSFTSEHLEIVEIICLEGVSIAKSLEKLLLEGGVPPGQVDVKDLDGTPSAVVIVRV
ncbi:hypothetical protein ACP4OV_003033 [Aristida adscensionis]